MEFLLNRYLRFRYLVGISLLVFISACSKITAPEFRSIDDLQVNTRDSIISISGQGRFYNPNKSKLLLKSTDITVSFNDQPFTRIKKDFNISPH